MQFAIKCETYVRLNNVLRRFKDDETRDKFANIYVERKNGNLIAVATNGVVLAAELIGHQSEPDAHMYLSIDPILLTQARQEEPLGGSLHVIYTPMLNHAAIKTTFGYQYPANGLAVPVNSPVSERWRMIVDRKETASPMMLKASSIADLGDASPSGTLVFPDTIDGSKPVVVRDENDPNWFGMFLPTYFDDKGKRITRNAATVPEWGK